MEHQTRASRRAILGAAALIGAAALPGSLDDALAQATPSGDPARVAPPAWFLTLHQLQDPYPGLIQVPADPPAGTRYVAAEIQIDNESDQALAFTPADIRLRDDAGFEFRGGTAVGTEPMLTSRNLNGGERSRGWVWFTVTADALMSSLVYVAPSPYYRVSLD